MEIDASLIPLPIFPLVVLNITLWIDPFDMSFLRGDVLRGNIGSPVQCFQLPLPSL